MAATATSPLRPEGLRGLIGQWLEDLSRLLLPHLHRPRPWRALFLRQVHGFKVFVRNRGGLEEIGDLVPGGDVEALARRLERLGPSPDRVVLRLSPSDVVRRELSVPEAARGVIEHVLRNQLERIAPWPAALALFDYEIAEDTGETGRMKVRLTVTGRPVLEPLLAELGRLGLRPGVVDCGEDASTPTRINLLGVQAGARVPGARTIGAALAALTLGALAYGGVDLAKVYDRYQRHVRLEAQIADIRQRSEEARRLARENAALMRRNRKLIDRKGGYPSAAVALEALSRTLPDSAWLTRLELRGVTVRLAGKARNTPALIATLEASPHLAHVHFSAPTTRKPGDAVETFAITAEIRPGVALAKRGKRR